jgi:hypothetical protein
MQEFIDSIIDWEKFDATTNISKRLNGVTKEHLEMEVSIWNKQLQMLETLNYEEVKKEIMAWEIAMPSSLSEESLYSTYSRLINYKTRLGYLMALARAWKETCESAIKYIEDLAPGAFTGTGPDKKANAMHVIQPFVHLRNQTARTDNFLIQMHNSVLFCANQIDLVIKERQSRAKLNYKLGHAGEDFISSGALEQQEINIEEDGEIFQTVKNTGRK